MPPIDVPGVGFPFACARLFDLVRAKESSVLFFIVNLRITGFGLFGTLLSAREIVLRSLEYIGHSMNSPIFSGIFKRFSLDLSDIPNISYICTRICCLSNSILVLRVWTLFLGESFLLPFPLRTVPDWVI